MARTRVGRAFIAIRDNDLAAEVMGVNLFYYKMLAFFIGCFLAGIAGSLLAHWTGSISTDNFSFMDSILYVGMIIIGGLGTTLGPILGVILIQLAGGRRDQDDPGFADRFSGDAQRVCHRYCADAVWPGDYPVPDIRTAGTGPPLESV